MSGPADYRNRQVGESHRDYAARMAGAARAAELDRDTAQAAIGRVRALHTVMDLGTGPVCSHCTREHNVRWPCMTIRVLNQTEPTSPAGGASP